MTKITFDVLTDEDINETESYFQNKIIISTDNIEQPIIIRKKDPEDNRAYKIYLTPKGRIIEPKLYNILQQLNETLSEGLTDAEKQTMIILLKKIEHNILAQNRKTKGAANESST